MKTNGTKVFLISTAVLFVLVLIISVIGGSDDIATEDSSTDDGKISVITTTTTKNTSKTDDADKSSDTEETDDTDDLEELEELANEPKEDPADADNTWAMFLVNGKNPVSEEYCDNIETSFVYSSWRDYYMDSRVSEYLKQMIADAADDGINLIVVSAYRTIQYQQNNFDNSVQDRIDNQGMTYEEAYADTLKEVQLPGYSEHNAGVAADIMSDECVSMDDDSFKNTKAYAWLMEHAADYGFILRYPEGKEDITDIIYEPWHYRFVGVYYAKLLTERGITMEEYFEEMNWVDEDGVAVYHLPEED